jgi:RHS repeat-associated protein
MAQRGGITGRRVYSYDALGNRTTAQEDCWSTTSTFAAALGEQSADRLRQVSTQNTCTCDRGPNGTCIRPPTTQRWWEYDTDGRPSATGTKVGSTEVSWTNFNAEIDGAHAALGAVFRSVNVNGAVYEYFYDAQGRRRLKLYPSGAKDEFFFDGDKLLVDRGYGSVGADWPDYDERPVDEYLWLDGRPVALIRSKLDPGFWRIDVTGGDCMRNGEARQCGVFFPVTDSLKKPVLLLDFQGRVVGEGDYDAFGHVNRATYLVGSKKPEDGTNRKVLGFFNQPHGANTEVQLRARLLTLDASGGELNLTDRWARALPGQEKVLAGSVAGATSAWATVPQDGLVHLRYTGVAPGSKESSTRLGFVLAGYEVRRSQTGASPTWLPLRFPGQYHDAETDLFENWNRYYDPSIGRYLGPEPKYVAPEWVLTSIAAGAVPSAFSYASSNPVSNIDPTGLDPLAIRTNSQALQSAASHVVQSLRMADPPGRRPNWASSYPGAPRTGLSNYLRLP